MNSRSIFPKAFALLAFSAAIWPVVAFSDSKTSDELRQTALSEIMVALEGYSGDNQTYSVIGGGNQGLGQGWFHYEGGGYSNSIASLLLDQGYLNDPLPKDPLLVNPGSLSGFDFLVYHCLDRVAVFSKSDSLVTDADSQTWWDDNQCTQYPISSLYHPYFVLSQPLEIDTTSNLDFYELVFEDDFDSLTLDKTIWNTALLWGPYLPTNNEQQLYVDTLGMHADFTHNPFTLTGETLKIIATPTSSELQPPARPAADSPLWQPNSYSEYNQNFTTGSPGEDNYDPGYQESDVDYLSGIITSYGSFNMTHGYVEMRAKLPAGRGLWPAFWMLPQHYVKDVPEIDVMEFLGQDVGTLYHTYHYFDVENNWNLISTPSYPSLTEDWTTDFHTFGMAWSPTEIVWYVDGEETKRITDSEYLIPNQAMHLLANLAVGGNWPGEPDETTPFPATFEIDYIRAYKKTLAAELDLASDYQLMFDDDFNADSLDASKWNTHFLWGPYLPINNEEQYYVDALGSDAGGHSPFSIENGVLSITARTADDPLGFSIPQALPGVDDSIWSEFETFQRNLSYTPQNYTSGILTSYDAFKFAHGYAEVRAKIPKGAGQWPAFWLLNGYYVSQQPEIDIMEVRGENPGEIIHSYHHFEEGELESESFSTQHSDSVDGYSADFHTYGVRWQPGKIDWYIDGELKHTFEDESVGYQVMYVIVNLAVGGNFNYSAVDPSLLPSSLDIDYIRVYQEKGID